MKTGMWWIKFSSSKEDREINISHGATNSGNNKNVYRSSLARWFVGALIILVIPLMHNLRRNKDDRQVILRSPPLRQHVSVRFIPYPHKTLGSGTSLQCQWGTRPIIIINSTSSTTPLLDFTQQNAYTEGICIPPTLNDTLHIFSSAEAIQCLSSDIQNRDIKLMLSGDSYMKQLYIGLADILLSRHISGGIEIMNSSQRMEVMSIAQREMEKRRHREKNSTFPFVQYGEQCYGLKPLNEKCLESIYEHGGNSSTDYVWVIGFGVHIYRRTNQVKATIQEINNFLANTTERQTIFVSPPYYYPHEQLSDQLVRDQAEVYTGLLHHPSVVDVYELTRSCLWENCSYDKAHRSRFVNRWKAQLLLNTLCEVQ